MMIPERPSLERRVLAAIDGSAGGGVRLGLGPKWRVSAEVAVPVKRPDPANSGKARFFFGIGRAF